MYPGLALFCAVLPLLVFCSGPDNCTLYESRFHGESPELESLLCYNDYKSQIDCQWREELSTKKNMTLELWIRNTYDNRESLCEPLDGPPTPHEDHHRLMRCRFNTSLFAISINYAFFFKTPTATSCSSLRHTLDLSQQLRVRPPVDLSVRISEGGDQLIQWSSPYPVSSPLSQNLTYQLSYRMEGQDTWKSKTLKKTHLKLRNQHLDLGLHRPGCWCEARVRAMGMTGGLWSKWSPLVTWKTPEAADQTPSMQCVLDGEEKVTCSWELRKELAHFITYQVECRHNKSTIAKRCCVHQEVTPISRHSEALLRYSCSLTSSSPEHLMLELIPELNAKSFVTHKNIRPHPPVEVKVAEKGGNWIVKWEERASIPVLSYQVRYWNTLNKEDTHLQNITEGFTSLTITGASLDPSQPYKVQVRALLPEGTSYTGPPSEWTQPKEWDSHAGSAWSPETLLYVGLCVLAALVFLALFFSIQASRRKVVAWLKSGPSPNKSKLFLESKNFSCNNVILENEIMDVCRVSHLDSFSSCNLSEATWDKKRKWQTSFSEDEGCLDCDRLPSPNIGDQIANTSAVSFNGPYIICKGTPESPQVSVAVQQEVNDKDAHSGFDPQLTVARPEPFAPTVSGTRGDYVFLPNSVLAKSTEELVTHGNNNNNSHTTEVEGSERAGQGLKGEEPSHTDLLLGHSNDDPPPPYTPMQFPAAPHGDTVQPSGYCILP